MLDTGIKQQLSSLFENLKHEYTFEIKVDEKHASSSELIELLEEVASVSVKIKLSILQREDFSFTILKDNQPTGIYFKAIPTGHEFTSLLLAILNLDGIGKNLPDEVVFHRIKNLKTPLEIKSYISLSCTNCPDVVQALNVLTMHHPDASHVIIDGALHQKEIESLNIQAVPSVYLNGELLHVGRASLGELIQKIEQQTGFSGSTEESTEKEYDLIIAGGGPAGVAAAIYSARKGFKVALVAEKIGGQVNETAAIENMISISQTSGNQLSANMVSHLEKYPVAILANRMITSVELDGSKKIMKTSLGETLSSQSLIITTGASWRKLNVPGEADYIGSGVAFCTHCDGPFYTGKKVVVIGGGNSGLEAAIDLSSIASEVTILEFMDQLKGDKILQEKLLHHPKVKILTGAQTLEILGDGKKVTGLRYKNRNTGQIELLDTDGVFVQIGLLPNSQPFKNIVNTNPFGEIEIDAHCRTNVPGIYAAGDVTTVPFKQIVIAMGEGAKAALSTFEDRMHAPQPPH